MLACRQSNCEMAIVQCRVLSCGGSLHLGPNPLDNVFLHLGVDLLHDVFFHLGLDPLDNLGLNPLDKGFFHLGLYALDNGPLDGGFPQL